MQQEVQKASKFFAPCSLQYYVKVFFLFLCCAAAHTHCQLFAFDKKSFCSGVYHCLEERPAFCTEALCIAGPDIEYDEEFCSIFKELRTRGLEPEKYWGKRIYAYLSRKHRITYMVEDTLPLAAPVMRYLMNHPSFAAQLINAYQKTSYSVRFVDRARKKIRGTNGKDIYGVFTIVLQNDNRFKTTYFGYGTAHVLMWQLYGRVLVVFDYTPVSQESISYRLRCIVFPANSFLKSIMNFVLFRKVVLNILKENIENVQTAALEFHRGNVKPLESYPAFYTPEGRNRINEFRQLLQGSAAETLPATTRNAR